MGDTTDETCENIDRLIANHLKQGELLRELKRALRLAQLMGLSPKDMPKTSVSFWEGTYSWERWRGAQLRVLVDGKLHSSYDLKDVHHDLWPADVLADYQRSMRRRMSAAQRSQLDH